MQTLSMLFQLTGRLIDVKALVSGFCRRQKMYRELRPAAFHPLSIAQACRELLLILRCWRIIRFLLLTGEFSAFRCQCQAFTSSFWIRYFTKWSLLGKRECVTRSFSVAFHHTLANSQLWAVLDDSSQVDGTLVVSKLGQQITIEKS